MKKWFAISAVAVAVAMTGGLVVAQTGTKNKEPIDVIKTPKVENRGMVELGQKLFFDPRLSKSGFISCNSCHNLSMGGSDNLKTSIGHNWQKGPINSPTVLNSSLNLAQFWDGRAKDLKSRPVARLPILARWPRHTSCRCTSCSRFLVMCLNSSASLAPTKSTSTR